MAITRRKALSIVKIEKSTPPIHQNSIQKQEPQSKISKSEPIFGEAPPSAYENVREQRIKENRERFEKLGILNLSLKFNATTPKPRPRPWKRIVHTGPRRRSSRLSGETPVSSTNVWAYIEPKKRKKYERKKVENKTYEPKKETKKYVPKKKKKTQKRQKREVSWSEVEDEGQKEEVYNEKHEKLLGNTDKEWTLCVDGYGAHGRRIYDPLNGKTCHQCRQKTLGLRTHCVKCQLVTGQFCGDCLYMRYGEHVVEANENPNWICPPCRGICNCSLCRKAKGWPPTGLLYKKAKNLGFKSVAHYLIKTKRTPLSSTMAEKKAQSVKRYLPFDSMEVEINDRSEMELNIDGRKLEEIGDDVKESVVSNTTSSNEDNNIAS